MKTIYSQYTNEVINKEVFLTSDILNICTVKIHFKSCGIILIGIRGKRLLYVLFFQNI